MPTISYFNSVKDKTNIEKELSEVLSIIKNGKLKALTQSIKQEPDKEKRSALKIKLPAVTISGTFNNSHKADDFKEHSGLMGIDIDDIPEPAKLKEKISNDKYTYACFISPSGNGLKVIVKIKPDRETHLQHFISLQAYYKNHYDIQIDEKCKDICRLMFLCSDPEMVVNENSEIFQAIEAIERPKTKTTDKQFNNNVTLDVEKVIEQIRSRKIDITANYNDWLAIGFALADEFGESGRSYFHKVSENHPDYNQSKADKQFDECYKTRKNEGIKPFFSIAKKHGIDISPVKDRQVPQIKQNDGKTEHGLNSENIDQDIRDFGFYTKNNSYYFRERRKNNTHDEDVSNFIINVLYNIETGNTGKYILELTNKDGQKRIYDISKEDFVNINKFKAKVEPNYLFYGNTTQLYKIKSYIFKDIRIAKEITTLGYQPESKIFAFSNGIIDEKGDFIPVDNYGVVKYNDSDYYLPAFSEINIDPDPQIIELQKFIYKTSNIDSKKWFVLQKKAYGFNGILTYIYDIASLFSDIVFKETTFYPYLYKFGVKGTAKNSSTELSSSRFGIPLQALNLEGASTEKSYARRVAQIRNGLVAFDEYTNNIASKMIGFLKGAYNRIGYDRAATSNDNRTHSTSVCSAIVILGNDMPTKKSALFERVILQEYTKGTTHNPYTKDEELAYKELAQYADRGIGNLISELFKYRHEVELNYRNMYNKLKSHFKYVIFKDIEISTRTINNICSILAPYYILSDIIDFGINDEDLTAQIIDNVTAQNILLNRVDEINIFWQAVEYLTISGSILKDKDFRIITKDNIEQLHLRFNLIYPKYNEYCQKQKLNVLDEAALFSNLKSNKSFIKSDSEDKDTHTTRFKEPDFKKTKTRSAMVFYYNQLNINLKFHDQSNPAF
jgi:hypothetical protein